MTSEDIHYSPERGNGNTLKQEIWRVEDKLLDALEKSTNRLEKWHDGHESEHNLLLADLQHRRDDIDKRFSTLVETLQTKAVIEAKKEGGWAMALLILNTLGRNWKIFAAIIAGVLFWTNNIHISLVGS